jgi:branched-chain amino acid transport system substrate-binding protein
MAVLYCAESPACAQTVAPLKAAGKTFGIPVVFDASVLDSSPNYVAQCLAAKQAGADVMFIADAGAVSDAVAASCSQQGYTPHQVSDEGAYDQAVAGKPGWNGFLGTQDNIPFFVTSTPGTKLMHDALNQYEPSVLSNPQWNVTAEFLWTTGLLIAQAAKVGGVGMTAPLSGPALWAGLYKLHSTNLGGMVPTLTFVKGVPDENHCWFWAGIENGKWTLPFGLSTTCAPYQKI